MYMIDLYIQIGVRVGRAGRHLWSSPEAAHGNGTLFCQAIYILTDLYVLIEFYINICVGIGPVYAMLCVY